jgi:hypothetical protein
VNLFVHRNLVFSRNPPASEGGRYNCKIKMATLVAATRALSHSLWSPPV